MCLFSLVIVGGDIEIKTELISTNGISVQWSTNISNIASIVVVANNTNSGVVSSALVERNEKSYLLIINPADQYEVTVTIIDSCQNSYTSEAMLVLNEDATVQDLFTVEQTSSKFCIPSSPTPIVCEKERQGNSCAQYG